MNRDARQLFESIGQRDFAYRELVDEERQRTAAARLPVPVASRSRSRPGHARNTLLSADLAAQAPVSHVIALVSLVPGTGRTTVAANVAAALSQDGRRCLAVGLDPANDLARQLGFDPAERLGLTSPELTASTMELRFRAHRRGLLVVPFGVPGSGHRSVEGNVALDPTWLGGRLTELLSSPCAMAIIDTPAGDSPWTTQALGLADEVLVVLRADQPSYASLLDTDLLLEEHLGSAFRSRSRYLLNRFDARRPLDREVRAALRHLLGNRLLPFVVQHDAAVPESAARGHSLLEEGADSQAAADLQMLADHLLEQTRGHSPRTRAASTQSVAGTPEEPGREGRLVP